MGHKTAINLMVFVSCLNKIFYLVEKPIREQALKMLFEENWYMNADFIYFLIESCNKQK